MCQACPNSCGGQRTALWSPSPSLCGLRGPSSDRPPASLGLPVEPSCRSIYFKCLCSVRDGTQSLTDARQSLSRSHIPDISPPPHLISKLISLEGKGGGKGFSQQKGTEKMGRKGRGSPSGPGVSLWAWPGVLRVGTLTANLASTYAPAPTPMPITYLNLW